MELHNKVVLVTGGGTGVGRATSMLLAKKGAMVAVNYSKSETDAAATVQAIRDMHGQAIAVKADVSNEQEVQQMVADIVHAYGNVHYLVNNASITEQLPMRELDAVTDGVWDRLLAVNVKGMFYTARAVAPYMRQNGEGAIVNLGSVAGTTGLGSSLPYAVSKAAVHGLTKSLAHALAPEIRVNAIAPGAVDTRWWAGHEVKMNQLAGSILLQRISTPEDIAESIVSMLLQRSLTGQIITVDNGQTM